jgi:hypothetical protein
MGKAGVVPFQFDAIRNAIKNCIDTRLDKVLYPEHQQVLIKEVNALDSNSVSSLKEQLEFDERCRLLEILYDNEDVDNTNYMQIAGDDISIVPKDFETEI